MRMTVERAQELVRGVFTGEINLSVKRFSHRLGANILADEVTRLSKDLAESERDKAWRLTEPDEDLKEIMEESGFWKSCSGCHETNEGASTGWYSVHPFFKCEQGAGCGECGGIGVIWDDTDYEDMAKWMREEEVRQALKGGEG